MQFKTMDPALRRQLLENEKDVLAEAVPEMGVRDCPKCDEQMLPQRPHALHGLVPTFDYKCPKCGTFMSGGSGVVITG